MKNAIIVHGMPDKEEYYASDFPACSNYHWLPWLQKEFIRQDIKADTPEMPHAYAPDYSVWKREFERFDITPETILVGHSCGGGFLVRWLSENKDIKVGKVVLVAPWLDVEGELETGFFNFTIDPQIVTRAAGMTIFNSDNDNDYIQKSVQLLRNGVEGIAYREFHQYGHFCLGDMNSEAFPELLEEVLK